MNTDDILSKPIPAIPQEAIDALNRVKSSSVSKNNSSSSRNTKYGHHHHQSQQQQQQQASSLPPPRPPSFRKNSTTSVLNNTSEYDDDDYDQHDDHCNNTSKSNLRRRRSSSPPSNNLDAAFATEHSDQFHKEQLERNKRHGSFRSLPAASTSSPPQMQQPQLRRIGSGSRPSSNNRSNKTKQQQPQRSVSNNVYAATPSSTENTQQSIAEETRQFARRQLAEFRAAEGRRTESYRLLRSGLRNIETIIQDIPIGEQLAKDIREKPPSEQTIHLQIVNTAMHRKITELTELLELSVKSEDNLRKRLALAEQRAASAENKIIDLQAKLFEAELKNMQGDVGAGAGGGTGIKMGRKAMMMSSSSRQ